jgi:predicted metal-dependent peptidase
MNAEQKMLKARTNLVLDHPFFGCLALRLTMIEDKKIDTAATNGKSLWYNPDFIESLTNAEVTGLFAHEVLHGALGHMWRQDYRTHGRWNSACDYTINYTLVEAGFTLPEGGLFNNNWRDLSAEEIYKLLPDDKDKKKSGKGSDPGCCGAVVPATGDKSQAQAEMKAALTQALQVSQGKVPAELKRQIEDILDTSVPWYVLLRDFVEKVARNDYDWTRPSRRYMIGGICLPSLVSEELPTIAVAIDTSGSITEEQLSTFAAEASAIFSAYDTTIHIIYCDAVVKGEAVFTKTDLPMDLKMLGGGGTSFKPVFEHIEKRGYTPSCLIYFTDLAGTFPETEPDYPVMWLVPKKKGDRDRTVPFGEVVNF